MTTEGTIVLLLVAGYPLRSCCVEFRYYQKDRSIRSNLDCNLCSCFSEEVVRWLHAAFSINNLVLYDVGISGMHST